MNLNTLSLAFVSGLVLASGCSAVDPSGGLPPADAQLAVLNALDEGDVVDLILDGQSLPIPNFGSRTSRVIPAGEHRIAIRAGGGQTLSSASFTVAGGGKRTVIVGGSTLSGGAVVVVGADTASAPEGNTAKVRVINTVQGVPTLEAWLFRPGDSRLSAPAILSPVDFGAGTSGLYPHYVERTSGGYEVQITSLATGAVAAELELSLRAGEVWSVVVTVGADSELKLVPIQER